MLNTKETGILVNIIKHCETILIKIKDLKKEEFDKNEDIKQIICFNLLQIGELVVHLDTNFISNHFGIPWEKIRGMRNRIAHGYGSIKFDDVWNTAKTDIKPLNDYCSNILLEDTTNNKTK